MDKEVFRQCIAVNYPLPILRTILDVGQLELTDMGNQNKAILISKASNIILDQYCKRIRSIDLVRSDMYKWDINFNMYNTKEPIVINIPDYTRIPEVYEVINEYPSNIIDSIIYKDPLNPGLNSNRISLIPNGEQFIEILQLLIDTSDYIICNLDSLLMCWYLNNMAIAEYKYSLSGPILKTWMDCINNLPIFIFYMNNSCGLIGASALLSIHSTDGILNYEFSDDYHKKYIFVYDKSITDMRVKCIS